MIFLAQTNKLDLKEKKMCHKFEVQFCIYKAWYATRCLKVPLVQKAELTSYSSACIGEAQIAVGESPGGGEGGGGGGGGSNCGEPDCGGGGRGDSICDWRSGELLGGGGKGDVIGDEGSGLEGGVKC